MKCFAKGALIALMAYSNMPESSNLVSAQDDKTAAGKAKGVQDIPRPELGKPGAAYDWVDDH